MHSTFPNLSITFSKSGKLDKQIMRVWVSKCLKPQIMNSALLLLDSWNGQKDDSIFNEVKENCERLQIPPKTTNLIQPLDRNFEKGWHWTNCQLIYSAGKTQWSYTHLYTSNFLLQNLMIWLDLHGLIVVMYMGRRNLEMCSKFVFPSVTLIVSMRPARLHLLSLVHIVLLICAFCTSLLQNIFILSDNFIWILRVNYL